MRERTLHDFLKEKLFIIFHLRCGQAFEVRKEAKYKSRLTMTNANPVASMEFVFGEVVTGGLTIAFFG